MASQALNANHAIGPEPDQRLARNLGWLSHRFARCEDPRAGFGRENQRRTGGRSMAAVLNQ